MMGGLVGGVRRLTGCFESSRAVGSVPGAALAFDVAILATCLLGAWGMRSPLGGLMPAVGWIVTSYVLAMGTPGGSVVITNTPAGKRVLYGGPRSAPPGGLGALRGAWALPAPPPQP